MRQSWTSQEDDILLKFIRNKKTSRDAAIALNRTRNSCISRTRSLGEKFSPIGKKYKIEWSQTEDELVEDLISQGKTPNQAATILLRSGDKVCLKRAKELGLEFKKAGAL